MTQTILFLGFALAAALCSVAVVAVRSRRDAVLVLTCFVVALFGINARYIVTGLGGVGTPGVLVGVAAAWWWWLARPAPTLGLDRGINPVRVAVLVYLWFITSSWALTHLRPLTELETNGSGRSLITAVALTGIALLATDGIDSLERLDRLLRRVVAAATFLSFVGVVQFFFRFDIGSMLVAFPGLSLNRYIVFVGQRSIFNRPFGTALHPIEYGVVLGMLLPVAVHFAMHARSTKERRLYTAASGLIAAGIPLSVSRSSVLAVVTAMGLLAFAWNWRQRLNGAVLSIAFTAFMWAAVPGLIGTLRNLFTRASTDPSVTARIDRFPRVVEQVSQAPWLGIGNGTFSPEDYFLLDNQYYVTVIETGFVGLALHIALFMTAIVCARWVRRRAPDAETAHLAQALLGAIAVVLVVLGTFDGFSFRIFSGTAFLLVGCVGALWRLVLRDRSHPGALTLRREPAGLAG